MNPYVIFLDLKKAFDTVSYIKLLSKLRAMGLVEDTLLWLESYLTNRQQCVNVNGMTSDLLPIRYGVPQGSIMAKFCSVYTLMKLQILLTVELFCMRTIQSYITMII